MLPGQDKETSGSSSILLYTSTHCQRATSTRCIHPNIKAKPLDGLVKRRLSLSWLVIITEEKPKEIQRNGGRKEEVAERGRERRTKKSKEKIINKQRWLIVCNVQKIVEYSSTGTRPVNDSATFQMPKESQRAPTTPDRLSLLLWRIDLLFFSLKFVFFIFPYFLVYFILETKIFFQLFSHVKLDGNSRFFGRAILFGLHSLFF